MRNARHHRKGPSCFTQNPMYTVTNMARGKHTETLEHVLRVVENILQDFSRGLRDHFSNFREKVHSHLMAVTTHNCSSQKANNPVERRSLAFDTLHLTSQALQGDIFARKARYSRKFAGCLIFQLCFFCGWVFSSYCLVLAV